ncbi:MAG: TIM barrel protein [Planctomycetaceae bacterium]
MLTRRDALTGMLACGGTLIGSKLFAAANLASRKFTMDLTPGAIGVQCNQKDCILLAAEYGFESVAPNVGELATLSPADLADMADLLKDRKLVWGAAGLPVDFRNDQAAFEAGLKNLPQQAAALQQAGVTRVGTWLMPKHDSLSYVRNFRQHAERLRQCVKILNDHGLRFGMEYVGPKTLWASGRHSFIHTMAETKDLIAEIGQPHVGFVLDSWHWYTAHETVDDLKTLTNADIVACDLNDAPVGREIDQQIDSQRELPAATGVINLKEFLTALVEIGYDGPIRSEPFNARLNALDNPAACQATAEAMKTAFALVEKS